MKNVLFLFGQLTDEDEEWMMHHGNRRMALKGTAVIEQGQATRSLFIVLHGELQVVNASEPSRILATLGPGEIVGEMSFVDARPPSATVQCASTSVLFALDRELLEEKIEEDPLFAANFYRSLAIFLSHRIRTVMGGEAGDEDFDELDPNALDGISRAGDRFERLLNRFFSQTLNTV